MGDVIIGFATIGLAVIALCAAVVAGVEAEKRQNASGIAFALLAGVLQSAALAVAVWGGR